MSLLKGISDLMGRYEVFFIDLFGVVCDENALYEGVVPCLTEMSKQCKSVLFLTNSSQRSSALIRHLREMGVSPSLYQHVLSAGEHAYQDLLKRDIPWFARLGQHCYVLGDVGADFFEGLPLSRVSCLDRAEFVLVFNGHHEHDVEDKDSPFFQELLSRKLPMICINPHGSFKQGGNASSFKGDLIGHTYEKLGGRVYYHGKPFLSFYQKALEFYRHISPANIVCVGDSLVDDVQGAINSSLDSVFVPGGVHGRTLGCGYGTLPAVQKLKNLYEVYQVRPKFVVPGLVW